MRKSWDHYFMDMAYMASTRATCPRRHVGAIMCKNKMLLGSSYNGAPMGVRDCYEDGCLVVAYEENGEKKERCIRTIHAEQNLLLFTDREDREGATVYVTDQPCWTCANMLANSGVKEIVYHRSYKKDEEKVKRLMAQKGIHFRQLENYIPPQEIVNTIID
ncbi:cytidine/deoxycytidylate deaminase family protein [Microaerobacter geothermalis]|uniref:deoxycytidylate deaminase n=1 Tax=Microaerobacter geothermalis TaxID=674972 RepID=UPI001F23F2C9|nr:cytidine/deoxycytidylate deaminase family protein [Microaerobacter geothermalis]MCF6092887.1 cytidine/deoxycytidylate deaminase family protein [Microaerobacter geothermalis]